MAYLNPTLSTTNHDAEGFTNEFYPEALVLLQEQSDEYKASLVLEARVIAHRYGADMVLTNHVKEALFQFRAPRRKSSVDEFLILVGGAFLGAFLEEIITQFLSGNISLTSVYALGGFIGLFTVLWVTRK